MAKKIFKNLTIKRKINKRQNIHQLLFKHNFFTVVIFFVISLFLFNYIYTIFNEEQKNSSENLLVHNIITEIEQSRILLEEYRTSKVPQRQKELLLKQKTILLNIDNEIEKLQIEYEDSPTRYFLNSGIINGKNTINELLNQLNSDSLNNDAEFYKIYYRISNTYDYIYKYLTNQYLLAMVKENVEIMEARAQQLKSLRLFSIILFGILLLGYIISTSRTTRRMLDPIDEMVKTAKDISEGNFDNEHKIIEGPQELVFLEESLKNMTTSLKDRLDLINENSILEKEIHTKEIDQLKLQKELERAKFRSLQAQINPHFLFNTLNTIQLTALFENAEQTGKLIESLSVIFRYSLEHQDEITIENELFFIKQYLKIQKARFKERLEYTIKCGELCKTVLIPPLILQPLVENAINHGIEPKEEGGRVDIEAYKNKNQVIINICDTGIGFKNPTNTINNIETNNKGHNIGISNIIERLNIYFKNEATINFKPLNEFGGCKVEIQIPFEENNV
ncbi:MAG: sensor histidine kinase [Pleomorphochaeta sp.]